MISRVYVSARDAVKIVEMLLPTPIDSSELVIIESLLIQNSAISW